MGGTIPPTNCYAQTVAKFLVTEIIPMFGVPEVLSADYGTHLIGDVVSQVTKMMGVDQKFVSIYHGITERPN